MTGNLGVHKKEKKFDKSSREKMVGEIREKDKERKKVPIPRKIGKIRTFLPELVYTWMAHLVILINYI